MPIVSSVRVMVLAVVFAFGCGDHGAPSDATVDLEPVHFLGRFDTTNPGAVGFDWPASAIAARFNGTGLNVTLVDHGDNWFDVSIDDGVPTALHLVGSVLDPSYALADGLPVGDHDVVITKRTESAFGQVEFKGFTPIGGDLVPTPFPFTRRIEFISDSVTCGFEDLATPPACTGSSDTENENVAWGAVASRELDAMHTAIAVSGRGLLRNGDGSTAFVMPEMWQRTFGVDLRPSPPALRWDFSRYTPDVVVIFLGGNDFGPGTCGAPRCDPGQPFVVAYTAFIKTVRQTYPDAYIVGSWIGPGPFPDIPVLDTLPGYVAAAVQAANADGDTKVSFLAVPDQDCAAGECGCDGPNAKGAATIGAVLAAHIRTLTGW